ncbi:hypothetical protein Btru_010179 [Bulinus truncatus]|nr:hypothetical protein Btru_010179 [Bulinus truncatus]
MALIAIKTSPLFVMYWITVMADLTGLNPGNLSLNGVYCDVGLKMALRIEDDTKELIEDIEKLDNVLQLENDIYDLDSESEEEEDDHLIVDLDYSDRSISSTGVSFNSEVRNLETSRLETNLKLPSEPQYQIERNDKKQLAEQALFLNRMLQDTMVNHINKIKELLSLNASKMADLDENATDGTTVKQTSSSSFRAPFFRRGLSFPEPNQDVISKKQSKDYDIIVIESVKDPRLYFRKASRNTLKNAVIEDSKQKLLAPFLSRMESELEKKQKCSNQIDELLSKINLIRDSIKLHEESSDVADVTELEDEIARWEKEIAKKKEEFLHYKDVIEQLEADIRSKKKISDEEILAQVDSSRIDWMKISKMNFSDNTTWVDCQKAWENQVCPKLNTALWSIEESKKLKQIVAKSETKEWEKIAAEMGGGRTAFQCFSYYQRNLNMDLKSRSWSKEEEEKLIKVAQIIKDGLGHYRWTQVASLMDSRSPHECMSRFAKINPRQNRGKWSETEDKNLLSAYQMFGSAWSRIAKFVGTRNSLQCRDRYCNCLAPSLNFERFTYDDDVKLLKLHKKMGPLWAKMVPHFKGRTDHMLLARYNRLKKWKKKTEWFNKLSERTRKLLLGKSLSAQERQQLMIQTKMYYKNILGVDLADYKRQEQDKENKIGTDAKSRFDSFTSSPAFQIYQKCKFGESTPPVPEGAMASKIRKILP